MSGLAAYTKGKAPMSFSDKLSAVQTLYNRLPSAQSELSDILSQLKTKDEIVKDFAYSIVVAISEAHLLHAHGLNALNVFYKAHLAKKTFTEEDSLLLEKLLIRAFWVVSLRRQIKEADEAMWDILGNP